MSISGALAQIKHKEKPSITSPESDTTVCKHEKEFKRVLPFIPVPFYSSETSVGIRVNFIESFQVKNYTAVCNRTSHLRLTIVGTLNNQWSLDGRFNGFYQSAGIMTFNKFKLISDNAYFYGVGYEEAKTHEEYFKNNRIYYRHITLKKIRRSNWYAGAGFEIQYLNYPPIDDNQQINNPDAGLMGYNGGWNNALGAGLAHDTRDNNVFPTQGIYFQAHFLCFGGYLGGDFNYGKFAFDFSSYHGLKNGDVIAFNTQVEHNGNDVPFFAMATVGGEKHRGYYEGRVRDRNKLILQTEYRKHIGKFNIVGYAGAAWTSGKKFDYQIAQVLPTVGIGFRMPVTKHKFMLRVDFAFGKYDSNMYVGGGEAF